MKLGFAKKTPVLITASVIFLVCVFEVVSHFYPSTDIFDRIEMMTYDWRMRGAADHTPQVSTNLGFIAISETDIAEIASGFLGKPYGLYWPRQIYGRLVNELAAQGARAVGFDIIMAEERPDQDVYGVILPNGDYIGSDSFFTNALRKAGNVILAATREAVPAEKFEVTASALGDVAFQNDDDGILRRNKPYREYRIWTSRFRTIFSLTHSKAVVSPGEIVITNVDGLNLKFTRDADGRVSARDLFEEGQFPQGMAERIPPYRDIRVWSMGIQMAAKLINLDLSKTEIKPNAIVFHGENGLTRTMPLNRQGDFFIPWNLRVHDKRLLEQDIHYPLAYSMERTAGNLVPNVWRDKVILVGSTATGNDLKDRGATPLENDTFLASKHWNIANSLVMDRFIRELPLWMNLMMLMFLGFVSATITWRLKILQGTLSTFAFTGVFVFFCWSVFVQQRLWIPIVLPAIGGILLPHISVVTYRVMFEEKEKRRVRNVFSRLVSPNVVNELLQTEKLSLGGSRRNITVYFADVRGFTQMTDDIQAKAEEFVKQNGLTGEAAEAYFDQSAKETLETVNLYLATIADTIKARSGTLDKYIGDCVMAFWGAPTPNERHAVDCVMAAIDAQRAMYALNNERFAENKRREEENKTLIANGQYPKTMLPLLSLGSGINSGIAVVGMMGSEAHIINYTVFGREINLASRLEGLSGRGRIIIGEGTFAELQRHEPELAKTCIEQAPTMLKGFKQAVRNFEVPWKAAGSATAPTSVPAASEAKAAIPSAPAAPKPGPEAALSPTSVAVDPPDKTAADAAKS